MSHEHDQDRARHIAAQIQRDADPTVSRGTKSSQLDAPTHPVASGLVQRKARDANGVAEGADQAVAAASSGSGSALPDTLMRKFESSLGTDLSSVRVHTGGDSAAATNAVGAKAYAMGQDIHFGAGQYDPSSSGGQHLIAHEVAHTVQQRGGSPTRQNKLEVSAPGDHLEHEADRAADAMIAGAPASVAGASGLARQTIMRDPLTGPDIMAPNASKTGIVYDVPSTDYRAAVKPSPPALTQEMPAASLGDPGPIPAWQAFVPPKQSGFGPFSHIEPGHQVVIAGPTHSSQMLTAWEEYKRETVQGVANTWDREGRARMNTYAQQAHGDPELDKIVADMKTNYKMSNMGQQGKGEVSVQAGQTNVADGFNAVQIAGHINSKGAGMSQDLAATAIAGQNGTVGGPVGQIVTELKAVRLATQAAVMTYSGLNTQFDGATVSLQAAIHEADIDDLKERVEDETKKQADIKSGKASLQKYAPEIAGIVNIWRDNKEQFGTISTMVKAVPGALERDPAAILEIGKSLLEIGKWNAIAESDRKIGWLTDDIKAKYVLKNQAKLEGAQKQVAGLLTQTQGAALAIKASLLQEKAVMNRLATAVQTNWQGADKTDGAMAGRAIHALPIVGKVIRSLNEMKAVMPKLPDVGTRAAQGFTLASRGLNTTGPGEMLKVAGWITGAPATLDQEIQKWTAIYAQLQKVTAGLGV